jgi:hypothetical protein
MSSSPIGSRLIGISTETLVWAVTAVCRSLSGEDLAKLKINSGEHLAAILATAFLGTAPVGVEPDGGPDLVFDVSEREQRDATGDDLLGLSGWPSASFEVKSLPGGFRKFDADIDKARDSGSERSEGQFLAEITSINDALRDYGRLMIERAKGQLDTKAQPGHSKHVFLVAHFFDYPAIECLGESPLIAHLLEPLSDVQGVDSVWVLWAPSHLVVWSTEHQEWINLMFGVADDMQEPFGRDDDVEVLQSIESLFLEEIGSTKGSPYLFGLTVGDDDQGN